MKDPGVSITRTFEAPREHVWREWTEPERFSDWYGGPAGKIPLDTVEMDVRVGGKWKLTMFFGPQAHRIDWDGEYVEVEEPSRLAFTVSDEPGEDRYALCTVDLADLGDGRTEMHFEQEGGQMPAEAYRRTTEGWGGFFDRMAERLRDL
jgi:uncharacterized protein YndB with AHSA1/START domain